MPRLFVALRPPKEMRVRLLEAMGGVQNARWQREEQLHLTLRFIGEVDERHEEEIASVLSMVDGPQVQIALAGIGTFGSKGRTRAIWAAVAAEPELTQLQRRIDRAVIATGVPAEPRAFKPHITLARLGAGAGSIETFAARTAGLASAPSRLDAFYLFESRLSREGADYQVVARYPLH